MVFPKLDEAIRYAVHFYKGNVRKFGEQPYICHPIEVLSLASMITRDEDILCVAVLHDTVEDSTVTLEDIKDKFGDKVAEIIAVETEDKRNQVNKVGTWKIRKEEAIEKIKNCNLSGAKIVCLCDKLSNLRSFHIALFSIGDSLWTELNQKDPLQHYWYYNSLKDVLEEFKDEPIYLEYCYMIDEVFDRYRENKR